MKDVLIFAERVLFGTMTFIKAQAEALTRFRPHYIGLTPATPSLPIGGHPILLTRNRNALADWRKELYKWWPVAPTFHREARRVNARLIHAHVAEIGPAALGVASALRLPLILHLHGGAEILADQVLRRERLNWPFYVKRRSLWRNTSQFACVSEFIRRKSVAAGFPSHKLRVLYTGIDCHEYSPTGVTDKDLVLYVGRLVQYKAADHLIRAMQLVRQTCPNARLLIIGEGPSRRSFELLARELEVQCEFLGYQSPAAVRQWLGQARVFRAPSLTSPADGRSEALGHVFLEAQAMGVPVVSYHHGGIPEAVSNGKTGLLAVEGDIPGLAEHITRFLYDDLFWARCRERAIRWVRDSFDVKVQTLKLEELYDEVLTGWTLHN